MNKKPNISICFFVISLTIFLYLLFFLIPYADKHGFFNENSFPQQEKKLLYFFLSTPIIIGYIVYAFMSIKKIIYLKSLNYPLLVFNVYFGSAICLLALGGAILWLMLLTFFIPVVFLPVSLIIGVVKDIKYFGKNRRIS